MKKPRRRMPLPLRGGAYLLPSLATTGNLLLGFYAIVRGLRGDFQLAAILVFLAALADGLDGRIARHMGTDSDFGREYDSLADLLTFGVAPALLAFVWGLDQFGRVGWLVPTFYLAATAIRLARFNVQIKVVDTRYFVGLPAPGAAVAIASLLFFAPDREWKSWLAGLLMVALVAVAILMVSTFRYPSFKQIDLKKSMSYRVALALAAVLLGVAAQPTIFFLGLALVYTLSGPVLWLVGRLRRRPPPAEELEAQEAP